MTKSKKPKLSTRTKYNVEYPPKACIQCGKEFWPNTTTQIICSQKCKDKRSWLLRKANRDVELTPNKTLTFSTELSKILHQWNREKKEVTEEVKPNTRNSRIHSLS